MNPHFTPVTQEHLSMDEKVPTGFICMLPDKSTGEITTPQFKVYELEGVSIANRIEATLKLIEDYGVVVPEPASVREYLMKHDNLKSITLLACCKASAGFGANSQLSLELYSDRECDDRYLVLYIRQQKYDKDIIGAIDEISESFLDYLPTKDDGYILITTDFCSPK